MAGLAPKKKFWFPPDNARGLGNDAMWAINLQVHRIRNFEFFEPEIRGFISQQTIDFQFLLTALNRLRHVAELLSYDDDVRKAIKLFDKTLPFFRKWRNVQEHMGEYQLGQGRDKTVSHSALRVFAFKKDGVGWLGDFLDYEEMFDVCGILWKALKAAPFEE